MNNPLIQSLLNQLKTKEPKGFQFIQNLMANRGNPEPLVKQVMGNMDSAHKEQLLSQAKNYGVPDEILSKIQNMK